MNESKNRLDPIAIRRACDSLIRLYESEDSISVLREDSTKIQVLHGLCQHAVNQGRAALVLLDADLSGQAVVNIRVALEHAVTAQWALLTPNGIGRLESGAKKKSSLYYESANLNMIIDTTAMGKTAGWNELDQFPNFSSICDELDSTHDPKVAKSGTLRFEYVRLSQSVHVTGSTIAGYLGVNQETVTTTLNCDQADRFAVPNLCDLAMALAMSCWVVESLRAAPNRLGEVERIASEVNIPASLVTDYEISKKRKGEMKE